MTRDNIRILEEFGDDIDRLCSALVDARDVIERLASAKLNLEDRVQSLEGDLDRAVEELKESREVIIDLNQEVSDLQRELKSVLSAV